MIAVKYISMDAAIVAILSEFDDVITEKKKDRTEGSTWWTGSFCLTPDLLWQTFC